MSRSGVINRFGVEKLSIGSGSTTLFFLSMLLSFVALSAVINSSERNYFTINNLSRLSQELSDAIIKPLSVNILTVRLTVDIDMSLK